MLTTIADHIKTHRHQLRQHLLYVGSGVVVPPSEKSIEALISNMAVKWAGDAVANTPQELRGGEALTMLAKSIPDHAQRCRMLASELSECRPAEGHIRLARMVADGYFSTIFLAEPDRLLEEALQVHHLHPEKDYHHLVAGVDDPETIRIAVEESSRMAIVKCAGDVESKFLPLTRVELENAYAAIDTIIAHAFKVFSVIVAHDERDRALLRNISRDGRRMFWVNPMVPVSDQRHYDELKVDSPASVKYHRYQPDVIDLLAARASSRHLICRESGTFNDFMARLHERLTRKRRRTVGRRDLALLRGGPYRFLDHFDEDDTDFFFGREDDTEEMLRLTNEHPVVVLFGRSGIGKTSLMRAGVIATLAQRAQEASVEEDSEKPWLGIYARCLEDPSQSIREATTTAVEELGFDVGGLQDDSTLLQFFRDAAEMTGRRLLIIIDQFEEYFVRLGDRVKERFLDEWTDCIADAADVVHWAIGIREDFVGQLWDLHDRIPEVMHHMYRLRKLTREQAKDAIVKPAQSFDVHFETELVEKLLEDLSREGIEPAQLQIVCDRLYEAKPSGQHTIGLHTYEHLGRAERILSQYLDYALSQFGLQDRRVARAILKHMVSSSEVLAISPIEKISEQLGFEEERIERVMARLVDFRLLRGVGEERSKQYQLVHEYLTTEIEDWMTETEIGVKDVQDLIARQLNNYRKFGLLIHAEELKIINDKRDALNLSPEELELILRSVAAAGEEVDYWFARIGDLGEREEPLLRSLMADGDDRVRRIVADSISSSPSIEYLPELVVLLDAGEAGLRERAAEILSGMERRLISLVSDGSEEERITAVKALGAIESFRSVPKMLEALPKAGDRLRDAIADTLAELDDPAAVDGLLRALSGRAEASWQGAYALAGLAEIDSSALEKLRREADRADADARTLYAAGLANLRSHALAEARRQLDEAARRAVSDAEGIRHIEAALQELGAREQRVAEGTEVWACFQGDAAHTGRATGVLTPPLVRAWHYTTEGPVVSSPVVGNDLVYIGSRDHKLYAIDAERGTEHWVLKTGDQIEATPLVIDDLVCVGSHDGSFYGVDAMTGDLRWTTRLGHAIRSSAVGLDGRAFVADHSGAVMAISAEDGRILWHAATRGEVTAGVALGDNAVICGSWDGSLYAFDVEDGGQLWQFVADGAVAATPTVWGDLVCCGSDDANVYGLDLASGKVRWRRPVGGYTRASAAVSDELFIVGSHDGRVYALEHETGDVAWRAETEDQILASGAVSGDVVYLGSIDGALYAIRLTDGEIVWKHQTLYGIYSSPAIVGQMLYVGIEHYDVAAFTTSNETTTA